MKLKNKTIWITGASSGIGEALAIEMAKKGNHLILSGRNTKKLKELKTTIEKNNKSIADVIPFDLSHMEEIENAARNVIKNYPAIDLLVNNGGISQRSFVLETEMLVDRKIMEINYFGNVALTKKILPVMIKNGGGQIAVTTSIVGKFGFPMRSAYSASKHALYGFYETLRMEAAQNNITVSMICPGRIRTNISYHAINNKGEEHGHLDKGQEKGMSAEKSAKKIVKGLEKEKKEILVGGKELLMVNIKKFFPGLFYKISQKVKST